MENKLDGGTYEIILGRLEGQAAELRTRLDQLNQARQEVFGAIETQLIANDRINTENHCVARDIVAVGKQAIFGYNVHIGLRKGIRLSDVFSIYEFREQRFHQKDLSLLADEQFQTDFQNLYRYYKEAYFARFNQKGAFLYMVFHLTPQSEDFKAFKWLVTEAGLKYVDNRSDHEVRFPEQYEFQWKRATRDDHRAGAHPHVSILDRIFVETVGGDLTIKVEDNTDEGLGIYREKVEYKDQTLDDAEFHYADLGNLVALKIQPYQEKPRYFVFNEKIKQVQRIDALEHSGVLLPDNQGLIFSNGYYLQTGEFKVFDPSLKNKRFKKRIVSPNGEDFFYVFYNQMVGVYVLMHYNIIRQQVNTPIICNGFTLFPGGELCYFKSESDPTKHHVIQIWQTPFVAGETVPSEHTDSYLFKVGNKDIVSAMAECQEILTLIGKEDTYADLYDDLVRRSTDVLDAYYWVTEKATFRLDEPLRAIRETANAAIGEYEKKIRIQRNTAETIARVRDQAEDLFKKAGRETFEEVDQFVATLAELRSLRGEIIGLKELRYTDLELVEALEEQTGESTEQLSRDCVAFLLQEDALAPYVARMESQAAELDQLTTAKEVSELAARLDETGGELELLIDIVSNLPIEDATQTTRIIDSISGLFTRLNQIKASVRRRRQGLHSTEAVAEFNAQIKLLEQSVINYLDVADTPPKCDEYLTKLMVQLEELEGRFVEIDEFTQQLADKREEIYAAFETRRNQLIEARNNRTASLENAADRLLTGIRNRVKNFREVSEINGFFASDLLVDKVRDIVRQLTELEDNNKANGVQTRLKTLKEEAVRQLRDRQELFVDGENIIKFGRHRFPVNVQPLELTVVRDNGQMKYHLTGTAFYDVIQDEAFQATQPVWDQSVISETAEVYRSEYLAYQLFHEEQSPLPADPEALSAYVREAAGRRYQEGYTKGVHDHDAALLLEALRTLAAGMGLLAYTPRVRACAKLCWAGFLTEENRTRLNRQLKSAGTVLRVFPQTHEFDYLLTELEKEVRTFVETTQTFPAFTIRPAAEYLFGELSQDDAFILSPDAARLRKAFDDHLKKQKATQLFRDSIKGLGGDYLEQYHLIRKWVQAFLEQLDDQEALTYLEETAAFLLFEKKVEVRPVEAHTTVDLEGLAGSHPVVEKGRYHLNYHRFMDKLARFADETAPLYERYTSLKRDLTAGFRRKLRLDEFKPRVLSSFVRNKLIDQVYLPIIGDNLAKQIGVAGEATRTDRMGLLLLISPPGYGKTTLMEYVASRLGLIFMKINGPAIGHAVTGLAPEDAPSLAARKELSKLNLAFEMGDNVMIYIDDIQHCHPEFLQKFISLCDAQRKIEGVYQGEAKTYDLRGRRVCVVMAGNPYTESGDRFQIPDMLANRADIYNLGDIIGDSAAAFKLSYLENALTSNPSLQKLAGKNIGDVHVLIKAVENQTMESADLQGNHSPEEIAEYTQVLEKLLRIRDVILTVNQAYIQSAAQADDYRTEPTFLLQGSYRNMNKLAEKIVPIMNKTELRNLLLSHYQGEVQTLTSGAEANFLKLKELLGWLTDEEQARWTDIKETFRKNKIFRNADGENPVGQVIAQIGAVSGELEGIREALEGREQKEESRRKKGEGNT